MKKAIVGLLAVVVIAVIGLGQDIQVKDQTPFFYAYLEVTGPYSLMSEKIGEFMGEYFSQGLGGFVGVSAFYFNAPGEVPEAEQRWRIGMSIGKETEPAAPLGKDIYDFPRVAFHLHVGPYEKLHEAYAKMWTWIDQNGWKVAGPTMETYLNNPMAVPPEKLETEIVIPVEKK